jgi:hypothetical protein
MNNLKQLVSSAPEHSILNTRFRYRSSVATDIRKTFARIRREQAKVRPVIDASTARKSHENARGRSLPALSLLAAAS